MICSCPFKFSSDLCRVAHGMIDLGYTDLLCEDSFDGRCDGRCTAADIAADATAHELRFVDAIGLQACRRADAIEFPCG